MAFLSPGLRSGIVGSSVGGAVRIGYANDFSSAGACLSPDCVKAHCDKGFDWAVCRKVG